METTPEAGTLTVGQFGSAPQWAANIVIVMAFLGYMHIRDGRGDKVAEQRIATCHEVQERGVAVMDRLATVMSDYHHDCASMRESFDRLERALERQADSLDDLRMELKKNNQ